MAKKYVIGPASRAEFNRVRRKVDMLSGDGVTNNRDAIRVKWPPPPRVATGGDDSDVILVKVTDPEVGGGKYAGNEWLTPTAAWSATANLAAADLGTAGPAVHILNAPEVGLSTHDLTNASNTAQRYFVALVISSNPSTGRRIVVINGFWFKDCT